MTTRNPRQGETIYYVLTIAGAEAVTGTGQLAYSKGCETPVLKDGTLSAGVFTTTFTAVETAAMLGEYNIEVKIKDSGNDDIGAAIQSTLTVDKSLIPDWNG